MSRDMTYFGYRIDRIMDDDGETVIGYDIMEPGSHTDAHPFAEMLPTIQECKEIIRAEVQFGRTFGVALGWEA